MNRPMTEDEFTAWRALPETKQIFTILAHKRDILRRQWEAGHFTDYEKEATALVNVGNMGTCKGYAFVEEMTYEEYLSEIEECKTNQG